MSVPAWLRIVAYLAITAGHAWLNHGFVAVVAQTVLALIGGVLLYHGAKSLIGALQTKPWRPWSMVGCLFLLVPGALTLLPAAPDSWLLQTPFGGSMLKHRSDKLYRAITDDNAWLAAKIADAGLGDAAPRDRFGAPLIASAKSPQVLQGLLQAGLEADARIEGGVTMLMRTRKPEMARLLLAHGADVDARDQQGQTPLMFALYAELDLIKVLVEAGADLDAVDQLGRTVGDRVDSREEIQEYLLAQHGRPLPLGPDLSYAQLARRDWLDPSQIESSAALLPSAISLVPQPMQYGELAEVSIRLSNDSALDRVLAIEVHVNSAALFVDASHDGHISNPHQPQLSQTIAWPALALPAGNSGVLTLRIIARSTSAAGDLVIDLRARNLLDHSEAGDTALTLYEPLSQNSEIGSGSGGLIFVLPFPLSLLLWLGSWRFLGRDHRLSKLAARVCAGSFALLGALISYSLTLDALRPYTSYAQSEAQILDRRFFLQTSRATSSSTSGSRSSTVMHQIPIVAVRYETPAGVVIATGGEGLQTLREFPLGARVPCWYDPQRPEVFVLRRGISIMGAIAILSSLLASLLLGWLAFRRRRV